MISDFQWQYGVTPLSTYSSVAVGVTVYVLVVAFLPKYIRQPVAIPAAITGLHNLILCFGSLAMFLGAAFEGTRVPCHSVERHAASKGCLMDEALAPALLQCSLDFICVCRRPAGEARCTGCTACRPTRPSRQA